MKRAGQSLLEVAIFGAIIIMLLGILITYGLRYNYQQQTMQQTFRKALSKGVALPGVGHSDAVVSDKHIPSPSDTFGVGSVVPFLGSAGGIHRDYLSDPPVKYTTEPTVVLNINGEEFTYTTAGFRDESNVSVLSLDADFEDIDSVWEGKGRYQKVYGSGNVWGTSAGACIGDTTPSTNPTTGEPEDTCSEGSYNIRIIDSCAGQIVDYGTAVKQCRMIVDSAACEKECNRENDKDINCNSICAQPIAVPWYCANFNEINLANHEYIFPVLYNPADKTGLFGFGGVKAIGLQQDYRQNTSADNALRKTEDTEGITTTDSINWITNTTRKIITNPPGSTSGVPNIEEVTSNVSQNTVGSSTSNW